MQTEVKSPSAAPPAVAPRRRSGGGVAIGISLIVVAVVAAGAGAGWKYYLLPLQDRVAALEAQDARLSESVAKAGGDDRLSALEKQIDEIHAGSAETERIAKQLSTLQFAASGHEMLADSIHDIQSVTAATSGKVDRLSDRLDQVEAVQSVKRQQGLRAEAVVLAVGQLREALRSSKPFANALASLRSLVGGDAEMIAVLDQLQPFAEDGVPSRDELSASFARLAPDIVRSDAAGDGSSWWRQALYHVESVISIRRVGEAVPGDETDAIVARAEAKLDAGDLKGAITALKPLGGLPSEIAASWVRDAGQRVTADSAEAELTRLSINRVAEGHGDAPASPAAAPSQ